MESKKGNGFVYVATGQGFVREALESSSSLRKCMPEANICLITDCKIEQGHCFNEIISVGKEEVTNTPIDKTLAIKCPYERVVFIDSDTYIISQLDGLFDILDGFEIAATPETLRGWHYDLDGLPEPFAEFTTGVLVFRNDEKMHKFFEKWRLTYLELKSKLGIANTDQPSFRKALFGAGVLLMPLPSEYHFVADRENYIMWDAKLIHTRNPNKKKIASLVNANLRSRVYMPCVGTFYGFTGHRDWTMRLVKFFIRGLRYLWKNPL